MRYQWYGVIAGVLLTPPTSWLAAQSTSAGRRPASVSRPATRAAKIAPSGGVEGDVFYLTKSGDVKRGAGLSVRLLATPDAVLWRLMLVCADYKDRFAPLNAAIRVGSTTGDWQRPYRQADTLHAETMLKADILLASAVVKTVSSGMNAHYRFSDVQPGRYFVHTRWPVSIGEGEVVYQWLSLVEIAAGKVMTQDLDTSTEASSQVYCGIE
jgi:hypothetical protein